MKKIVIAAVLLMAGVSASFAADTWGKLSLFDKIAYPAVNSVRGVELGLLYSNTQEFTGFQFTFIHGRAANLEGVQMAAVTLADKATAIQFGVGNIGKNMKGAQVGFVNYAEKLNGLQLGFINYTEVMSTGLQIGLVNIIRNSKLPIMVIANARF